MTQPWAPIRLAIGPVHVAFGSGHDCAGLLTWLLQRLQEQAPAEAAEWVQRDALRLCSVRPVAVERRDTLPSGPPAETFSTRPVVHRDIKPANLIDCRPDQTGE